MAHWLRAQHQPVKPIARALVRRFRRSGTISTAALRLYRRTGDRPIRAEHATVARFGSKQRRALFAFVEELAGVRGHRLAFGVTAAGTREHGFEGRVGGGHSRKRGLPDQALNTGLGAVSMRRWSYQADTVD